MGNQYRHYELMRIDEVSRYVGRILRPNDLPEVAMREGDLFFWWKQDIDDWLDAKRGRGGDQIQEAN